MAENITATTPVTAISLTAARLSFAAAATFAILLFMVWGFFLASPASRSPPRLSAAAWPATRPSPRRGDRSCGRPSWFGSASSRSS
jgi:hypothetical protein